MNGERLRSLTSLFINNFFFKKNCQEHSEQKKSTTVSAYFSNIPIWTTLKFYIPWYTTMKSLVALNSEIENDVCGIFFRKGKEILMINDISTVKCKYFQNQFTIKIFNPYGSREVLKIVTNFTFVIFTENIPVLWVVALVSNGIILKHPIIDNCVSCSWWQKQN